MIHRRSALLLAAALVAQGWPADGAGPDRPHPHQGLVEPYAGRPPEIALDAGQRAALERGEAILVTAQGAAGGRGMAVQDVWAPPELVWDRIGDFADYPRMVDHVTECEVYRRDGEDVRVRMVLRVMTFRYEYYIRHVFRPEEGYVTWTLDYARESDLDDSVGFWSVVPHPTRRGWSRLYYAIDMRTRGWMPGFLRRMVARRGLRDATAWVKRESEARHREIRAAEPGGEKSREIRGGS